MWSVWRIWRCQSFFESDLVLDVQYKWALKEIEKNGKKANSVWYSQGKAMLLYSILLAAAAHVFTRCRLAHQLKGTHCSLHCHLSRRDSSHAPLTTLSCFTLFAL
jgi:hypothetical protein